MRLFIAVYPPPEMQAAAWRAADTLRASRGEPVSWVKEQDLHCTMRFLGEVEDAAADRAAQAMKDAATEHTRFGATLGGFGAFPTARAARVLWIGMVHGAEPMRLLARSLEHALRKQGFERADDAFEPHLTVGRVRKPGDWTQRLIDAPTIEARFQVDRLVLVSSVLERSGARHQRLREASLAGV